MELEITMGLRYKNHLKYSEKEPTQGFEKLRNYFAEIIKSESFQGDIRQLREKYKIPKQGFVFDCQKGFVFYYRRANYYIPQREGRPGGSTQHIKAFFEKGRSGSDYQRTKALIGDIENLCKKRDLYNPRWTRIVWDYLFYNRIDLPLPTLQYDYDLCVISDVAEDRIFFDHFEKDIDHEFPIAIRVSPYASQRDILDFVKKNHKHISIIQEKYKEEGIKIGRIKTKNPQKQKRNEFIYEHLSLPRKRIMSLVAKQFGEFLDYGHIGKIISIEKKRRKDM